MFLHRIVPGGATVATAFTWPVWPHPPQVNSRAKEILHQLETDHVNHRGDSKITPPARKAETPVQLTLFDFGTHPVIEQPRDLHVESTQPPEALQLLQQWQQEARQ